jgi:hypothetical protein
MEEQTPTRQLPITVTALLLLSMVAFAWVKGGSWLLYGAAVLMLAPYLTAARLTADWLIWLARFIACATALLTALLTVPASTQQDTIFSPQWVNVIGYLITAELVVQCWSLRKSLTGVIILPSLLFLLLSDTTSTTKVAIVAPIYLLLVTLSFHYYRPRARQRHAWSLLLSGMLIVLTVAAGYAFNVCIYANRVQLFNWSERLISFNTDRALKLSLDPVLGETFGQRGSFQRMLRLTGYHAGYLRGLAFDSYANGRWMPYLRDRALTPLPAAWSVPTHANIVQVTELSSTDGVLYLPSETQGILPGITMQWNPTDGGPVKCDSSVPLRYQVAIAHGEVGDFWPALPIAARSRLLSIPPEIDPRVIKMAGMICLHAHTPQEKITAIVSYLQHHYAYSLRVRPGHGDPISNFLLRRKSAHCEYFASAATMLLRTQGVPTRYVIGYYAHEATGTGELIVRLQDAHAWAESWVDGAGWVVVDATPGDGRPDKFAENWQIWGVRVGEHLQDSFARFRAWIVSLSPWQLALLLLATMLPFFLLQIWNHRRRPGIVPLAARYSADDPAVIALGERFSAWLFASGRPCPPTLPWHNFVQSDDTPATAIAFVLLYNSARFGKKIDERTLRQLGALLDELEGITDQEVTRIADK